MRKLISYLVINFAIFILASAVYGQKNNNANKAIIEKKINISSLEFKNNVQAKSTKPKDFILSSIKQNLVSFSMYFTGMGFESKNEVVEVSGNKFNSQSIDFFNRCVSGTTIVVGAIKVLDKKGIEKELIGNISFILE